MKINEVQDKIIEEFSRFDDWFDIYGHLINLAKDLEPMKEEYKSDKNSISGCQSELWVYGELVDGKMRYFADSNTLITKGIASLIIRVVNDQSPKEVVDADLYFIDKIGLKSNLSPARSNGVESILKRIKELAKLNRS